MCSICQNSAWMLFVCSFFMRLVLSLASVRAIICIRTCMIYQAGAVRMHNVLNLSKLSLEALCLQFLYEACTVFTFLLVKPLVKSLLNWYDLSLQSFGGGLPNISMAAKFGSEQDLLQKLRSRYFCFNVLIPILVVVWATKYPCS